jgi:hypothetical protein
MSRRVEVADPRAAERLEAALRQRARGQTALVKLTRADATALTGVPLAQAEPALKSLVKRYRSHLAVTDEGELVYEFDPALERRDRVTLRERLARAGAVAWRGFTFAFKIWIVVVMIAYVVAFVAMMIALATARSSSDRDDRRGGGLGGIPWIWYWMMPDLAPRTDPWGRPLRRREGPPPKRFYQSVFDFVFGPKAPAVDDKAGEKRLIAFLRDHKGRITATELVALTGLSVQQAEEELTRLMVEYDGEVDVADDGTLIYTFEELLKSAGAAGARGESWRWEWDAPEPTASLTGNTGGANTAIVGFTAFNLIASMTVGPAFLARMHMGGEPWAMFLVTWFPLIFSALFFAVPAARAVVERRRATKRARRRMRRELLRAIWQQGELDPDVTAREVAERTGQSVADARRVLDRLAAELEVDIDGRADGSMRYRFPRLGEERSAVEKVRATARAPELGPVVFTSE